MSYFHQLKLQAEIDQFSLEDYRPRLPGKFDLESSDKPWYKTLYEYIKKFITWCKNKLIQLGKFIHDKLGKWFRNKKARETINKLKMIKSFNYLSKEEFQNAILISLSHNTGKVLNVELENIDNEILAIKGKLTDDISKMSKSHIYEKYEEFINSSINHEQTIGHKIWYLFNENGGLRNINIIMRNSLMIHQDIHSMDYLSFIRKYGINYNHYNNIKKFNDERGNKQWSHIVHDVIEIILKGHLNTTKPNVNKIIELHPLIEGFSYFVENYKEFEKQTNELIRSLENSLRDLENNIMKSNDALTDSEDRLIKLEKADKIRLSISILNTPLNFIANLIKFVDKLTNTLFSKYFTTTTESPGSKLYHLSEAPLFKSNKGVLFPQTPRKGGRIPLPPRISFSPTIEGCCYGMPTEFPIKQHLKEGQFGYGRFRKRIYYLYEGLPVKDKTRYIKSNLLFESINSSELLHSKEIAVVSDIEVRLIGKVEIIWDTEKQQQIPGRYKVEFI